MASMEEVLAAIEMVDLDRPWAAVAPSVMPVLRRRRPLPAEADAPLRRIYAPGLEVSFGVDIGPAFFYIAPGQVSRWGVTEDEVAARGLANVRARAEARRQFGLIRDTVGGTPLMAFQSREGWASALLLLPDLLARVFGPAPALILAPMRDILFRLPIDAEQELALWMLDEFTSLDPNALEVPVLALVDGDLRFASEGSSGWRRPRRH